MGENWVVWFFKYDFISLFAWVSLVLFVNLVENAPWNFKETAWSIQNLYLQPSEITYFSIIFFGSVGWGRSIYWQSLHCLLVSTKVHSEWVESVLYSSRLRIQGRVCEGSHSHCNKTCGRLAYFSAPDTFIIQSLQTGWIDYCWETCF